MRRIGRMGGGPSNHVPTDMMEHHHQQQPYPDMNMIFRGIPKMIQVADDMHRMTDYIMDLRNMTIGLVAISAIGCVGFLLLRMVNGKRHKRKRSLTRHAEEGYPPPRCYYPSQYAPEPWEGRPKSSFSQNGMEDIPEKKAIDSRGSPEQRPNGGINYKQFSNEEALSPEVEKKVPNPMANDVSAYRVPPGAHKRAFEPPCKLLVEDLPYADSAN